MNRLPLIAIAALFLATAGSSSPSLAQGGCVSRQEARELLEQGQAIPFPDALQRAGLSSDQLAGDPQLCQSGGGLVYRVKVYEGGQVTAVSIPAN